MAQQSDTRKKILKAASNIAQQVGSAKLTIDAVAKEAEVSKGGVLYHFPSKKKLIAGLLEYSVLQLENRVNLQDGKVERDYPQIRALIRASQLSTPDQRTLPLSVLTAASEDQELLKPVQDYSRKWCEDVERESPFGLVLLLAIEGLQFMEMLNLLNFGPEKRFEIFEKIMQLLELSDSAKEPES